MANILDFFTKGGQARTQDLIDLENRIAEAARYYFGPTGVDKRAGSAIGLIGESAPTTGITNSMAASGRGDYGEAAVEGAAALLPVGAAKIAGRYAAGGVGQVADDAANAVSEFLTGFSAPARDAGRVVAERLNQRGPMPTVYSNPIDFLGQSKKFTQDVFNFGPSQPDRSLRKQADDLIESGSFEDLPSQSVPVSKIVPTQKFLGAQNMERVSGATPDTGAYLLKQGDQYFVLDGHHRIAKNIAEGSGEIKAKVFDATPSLPPARNEAEAMAKRILDMRAAGNAADVTDEMMAQADFEYLFNNTPLPMDFESRMERARQMGFDVEKLLYHGTASDFPSFDEASRGGITKAASARKATWMADNPSVAGGYAEFAEENQVQRLIDQSYVAEANGKYDLANDLMRQAEQLEMSIREGAGGRVLPLLAKKDLAVFDAAGEKYDPTDYTLADKVQSAKDSGKAGVMIDNFIDNADYANMTEASHIGILDPRNIRSRFARFDPAFSHLKNLSAGVGLPVTGLLGYNAMQQDQR